MSSTNRGSVREASDFYVTPVDAVELFLREWAADYSAVRSVRSILDPCAGGILNQATGLPQVEMSYPSALSACSDLLPAWNGRVETLDIRPDSLADFKMDYLSCGLTFDADLVISNPPFALARQFITKGLEDAKTGGFVVMLLRLNFFGSEERKAWLQAAMPIACYVHSERMKFNLHRADLTPAERRKTDSIEYAHFVWQKGITPKFTQLRVI